MNLQKYLHLSSLLERLTPDKIQKFKTVFFQNNKNDFSASDVFDTLEKTFSSVTNETFNILMRIRNIVLWGGFFVGFLLGFFLFQTEVNINLFLLLSIVLPGLFMIFSAYRILSYSFPLQKEEFFFERFLKKKGDIATEDTHVFRLYSYLLFQLGAIAYAVGILLSSMVFFFITKVEFHFENTYNFGWGFEREILWFFSLPWEWFLHSDIAHAISLEDAKGDFALFVLLSILFWVIIPRIVLYFLVRLKLHKSFVNALRSKGKKLFDVLERSVEVESPAYSKPIQKGARTHREKHARYLCDTVCCVFYEMEPVDIVSEIPECRDKKLKTSMLHTFMQTRSQEEEILQELEELVIIFPSPQTLPDESFKSVILEMCQKEKIKQIWIAPLLEEGKRYRVLAKTDSLYAQWRYHINEMIDSLQVRLYNER